MQLNELIHREVPAEPWAEGEKIPWNDPEFSRRMLQEHLSQAHDAASRRFEKIDRQVSWIHEELLGGEEARILDLGCGPGLYTSRLARRGHTCVGIDFSPASIEYAQEEAERDELACRYVLEDVRRADYGSGYDLVMLIFGELNVFKPEDARLLLRKAHAALVPGGRLLLEPHTYAAVKAIGGQSSWSTSESGLFSDRPHITLYESFWDDERHVATERYFVIDPESAEVTRHAASNQAYSDAEYEALLVECGFGAVQFYPSLTGTPDATAEALVAIVARR